MGRAETRHSLEGRHRRQRRSAAWIIEIDSQLRRQLLLDVLRSLDRIAPVNPLGDLVRHFHWITEGAHRITDGVRPAVHLDDTGDRRLGAIVFVVDVVEHFLAPVVLDIDVDVRRLGLAIDANLREKSLEQ